MTHDSIKNASTWELRLRTFLVSKKQTLKSDPAYYTTEKPSPGFVQRMTCKKKSWGGGGRSKGEQKHPPPPLHPIDIIGSMAVR